MRRFLLGLVLGLLLSPTVLFAAPVKKALVQYVTKGEFDRALAQINKRFDSVNLVVDAHRAWLGDLSGKEGESEDREDKIEDLESSISDFKHCLRLYMTGTSKPAMESDLWHCAGKLP